MTPKQITKSIEVTERAIEKAKKNIAMYEKRRDNAFAKAIKKGCQFSLDNFKVKEEFIPTSYDGKRGFIRKEVESNLPAEAFNDYYPIISNWNSMLENQHTLEREERKLSGLQQELEAFNAENQVVSDMASILENAMQEFKKEWFGMMMDWHIAHHAHINSILEKTTMRRNRMTAIQRRMERQYAFWSPRYVESSIHGNLYKRLCNAIKRANEVIFDKASGISIEEYKPIALEMINAEWSSNMKALVKRLDRFNINLNVVKVDGIDTTSKGFECFITDGRERRIYARMIWAAEYSVMVAPHTRYIITERH